jgi:hypothetical protein
MSRERYRVYAEDEFFAAVADEHETRLEPSPSGIEAPRRHRVASVAVLMGVVGAIAGLVAIDVLAQRAGARRKAAPLRVARRGVGTTTVAALQGARLRQAQTGRARGSTGRGRVSPAHPRWRRSRHRPHQGSPRTAVDQANATTASTPLRGDPRHRHAVVIGTAGATAARQADGHADRIAVASSDDDPSQQPRVEFGFER